MKTKQEWDFFLYRLHVFVQPILYLPLNFVRFVMSNAAAKFDLSRFSLTDEAKSGKWFKVFLGDDDFEVVMELKIASSSTRDYQKKAIVKNRNTTKASGGKGFDTLPPDVVLNMGEELTATAALKGWSMRVPVEVAESLGLSTRDTYRSDDSKVEEGFVLVDAALYGSKPLEYSPENAVTLLKVLPDLREEVMDRAGNKGAFYQGGASQLD